MYNCHLYEELLLWGRSCGRKPRAIVEELNSKNTHVDTLVTGITLLTSCCTNIVQTCQVDTPQIVTKRKHQLRLGSKRVDRSMGDVTKTSFFHFPEMFGELSGLRARRRAGGGGNHVHHLTTVIGRSWGRPQGPRGGSSPPSRRTTKFSSPQLQKSSNHRQT